MKEQSIILLVFCVVSGTLSKPPPTFLEYKDSLGQYSFGYSAPGSARSEVRSLDGSTRGSYSYVDDAGVIQSAQYTADGENGFQVVATNLPRAPSAVMDTPEVAEARLNHLKALEDAAKPAEEIPEEQGHRVAKIDEKDTDTLVIDVNASNSAPKDVMGSEVLAKSANSETKSARKAEGSAEAQSRISGQEKEAAVVRTEVESIPGMEKSAEGGRNTQPIQSQTRTAVQSDVPVVTTSFVIPGTVNLHTRIELDQSDAPAARLPLESSALSVSQPSMFQGSDLSPTMITPAGTKMMTLSSSEEDDMLMKMAPLPAAAMQPSALYNPKQQPYSVPFAPSNIIAVPYAVGSIYQQYNPYQYFPFGLVLRRSAAFE